MWIHTKKIGRYRPSMCTHTKKNRSTVDIYRRSGHKLKKPVDIDLAHLHFITHTSKWLTRTLTFVHWDLLQTLFTKQHTRKKETHTDREHDGHRTKSVSRRSWWCKNYSMNTRFFTPPRRCVFVHKRVYVCVYTFVGEQTHNCNWIYIFVYLFMYIYICIYTYEFVYIYICTYVYIFIYIYILEQVRRLDLKQCTE